MAGMQRGLDSSEAPIHKMAEHERRLLQPGLVHDEGPAHRPLQERGHSRGHYSRKDAAWQAVEDSTPR
eukprot:2452264-Alexandrium_andersonii.AAC.1